MGQAADSNRNASLDDKKVRAAGRTGQRQAVRDAVRPREMKGKTGGAFGGGGGGDTPPLAKDEVRAEAGRSSKAARKRSR